MRSGGKVLHFTVKMIAKLGKVLHFSKSWEQYVKAEIFFALLKVPLRLIILPLINEVYLFGRRQVGR